MAADRISGRRSSIDQQPAGRRTPITDDLRIQIALRRYAMGRAISIKELSRVFDRDPAVISRCISAAFQRRLVEVRPAAARGGERDSALEHQLRQRYPALRGVIVI